MARARSSPSSSSATRRASGDSACAFGATVVVNVLVLAAFVALLQAGLRMPDLDYSGMLQ